MRFSKFDHFIYQSIYMQIRYAHFMFFLKNVRTICSKSTENTCRGKIALIDNCASTTSLTQFRTSESYFFAFAVSEAVLYTSTLNKFFFSFLHLQWSSICEKHHPTQTYFDLLEVGVDFELGTSYCITKQNDINVAMAHSKLEGSYR